MQSILKPVALGAAALGALVDSKPIAPTVPYSLNPGRILQSRAVTQVVCGNHASADITDNGRNKDNLDGKDETVGIMGGTCGRIACYNTSGVYVCNDQGEGVEIEMDEVVEQLQYLMSVCIGGNSIGKSSVSGQVFVDTHGGWNLNVGYCNGNDGNGVPPSAYGKPGPNGLPAVSCGEGDGEQCEGATCKENSIVVEEQKTVTCSSYHAGSYVGPGANVIYNTQRSVSTSWSVGGFLGIDSSSLSKASANGGFMAGFSETTMTGTTAGISAPCGDAEADGDFMCALHIRPQCYEMSGYCIDQATDQEVPWAAVSPQVAEDDIGVYTSETCTCGECPDADNEAAPDLCELPCDAECL